MNRLVTLRREGCAQVLGHVSLPDHPLVGDIVVDKDDHPWLVTDRMWYHGVGLTLVVRSV